MWSCQSLNTAREPSLGHYSFGRRDEIRPCSISSVVLPGPLFRCAHIHIRFTFEAQDLCVTVDPQPYPGVVDNCYWTVAEPNQRTITCVAGYWAAGPGQIEGDQDITMYGEQLFAGCYGLSPLCNQLTQSHKRM